VRKQHLEFLVLSRDCWKASVLAKARTRSRTASSMSRVSLQFELLVRTDLPRPGECRPAEARYGEREADQCARLQHVSNPIDAARDHAPASSMAHCQYRCDNDQSTPSNPADDGRSQRVPAAMKISTLITVAALVQAFDVFDLASADDIVLPTPFLDRNQPANVVYHLDKPATGKGQLRIAWTDACGRLVEQREIGFELAQASDVAMLLDMRRAVSANNELQAHLSFVGVNEAGADDRRENDAAMSFTVRPPGQGWRDYQIIMWQQHSAGQDAALKKLGVTAGMVSASRSGEVAKFAEKQIEPLLANDLRWYVENIATDFYSAYHRWFPDRPNNWLFAVARRLYREKPLDIAAFVREPSLSDPQWLKEIRDRLIETVRAHYPYRPLYYSLGDETGIADLAAFWDFDFSSYSLSEMRKWLQEQYGSLAALNRQWGSDFARWDMVVPMTTREVMQRSDANFSAWADFKEWMDVAFARALMMGTEAVHSADPDALAAIEGGQIPGWGGYNYLHLSTAVDVMELYDYGGNVDIVRSLNPDIVILTTSFEGGPREAHRVWRALLRGSRGLILWDEKSEFVREDGSPGVRGREAAAYFGEIRAGLGALLIASPRHTDPVAILYSPASFRTQWLLDQKPKGEAWSRRDASAEYEDNEIRTSTRSYSEMVQNLGLQPQFVSSELVEHGALRRGSYRILILPHAISLSSDEATEIRRFVDRGGTVIADVEPGTFDQHSRGLAASLLQDVFGVWGPASPTESSFGKGRAIRLIPVDPRHPDNSSADLQNGAMRRMSRVFAAEGVEPAFVVHAVDDSEPVTDVETHVFRNGDVTVIALQRDLPSSSESSDAREDRASRSAAEAVVLKLPGAGFIYDLRTGRTLGRASQLVLDLDPIAPTILSVSSTPLHSPTISGPRRLRLGETAQIQLGVPGTSRATQHVLHVDAIDPAGNPVPCYSGNVLAPGGKAPWILPLAFNDGIGTWSIRVTDRLSGQVATLSIEVSAPRKAARQAHANEAWQSPRVKTARHLPW